MGLFSRRRKAPLVDAAEMARISRLLAVVMPDCPFGDCPKAVLALEAVRRSLGYETHALTPAQHTMIADRMCTALQCGRPWSDATWAQRAPMLAWARVVLLLLRTPTAPPIAVIISDRAHRSASKRLEGDRSRRVEITAPSPMVAVLCDVGAAAGTIRPADAALIAELAWPRMSAHIRIEGKPAPETFTGLSVTGQQHIVELLRSAMTVLEWEAAQTPRSIETLGQSLFAPRR